ncbi:MAG: hypothetical protein LCI00_25010 [Chloroflexi bacterium]|nr:hypothetical protein [Chloroflexota bacterium]MCC6895753.1 hypothetical protein [Anaerolineae bacterium]
MMVSPELVEQLQQLSPAEKLRVVQILVNDLAVGDTDQIFTNRSYEIWSPFDSADAALKLQQMLDEDK